MQEQEIDERSISFYDEEEDDDVEPSLAERIIYRFIMIPVYLFTVILSVVRVAQSLVDRLTYKEPARLAPRIHRRSRRGHVRPIHLFGER